MALLNLILTFTLLCVTIETKEDLNLDDVSAIVGEKFDYQIGDETFLSTYKIYRIVQRGHRKLPSWLTYDTNSSMLIGYPKTEDVGMYTLRMRAHCIDPAVSKCQDKLSRTFHISVVEPLVSAESRGRKTFSKHGKKDKWRFTNMHNGNTGLYVEYDISRHGTVVEKQSGMLDSGSEHVLSSGTLYSAMQFDNVAKYFPNKKMHDKLSSNSYLAMQYNSASINVLPLTDLHKHYSSFVANYLSSMQHHNFIKNAHIHNSDILFIPSSELFSSMQLYTRIDRVQNNDDFLQLMPHYSKSDNIQYSEKLSLLNSELISSMQVILSEDRNSYKKVRTNKGADNELTFFPDQGFHSLIDQDRSKELLFTEQGFVATKKSQKEKSEESLDSDITLNSKVIPESHEHAASVAHGMPNICLKDQNVFYASLILYILDSLSSAQEVTLRYKWSKFISKDFDLIFIPKTDSDYTSLRDSGKYILTAGPGNVIESLSKSVELSWHLACEKFEQAEDFTQVLQHNIEVGRVSEEIGYDVIAWFVYTDKPLPRRFRRQANSRRRQTATPTYSPPVPTTLSEMLPTSTDSTLISYLFSFSSAVKSQFSTSLSFPPTSLFSVILSRTQPLSFSAISLTSSFTSRTSTFLDSYTSLFTTNTEIISSTSSNFISKYSPVLSPTVSFSDFSLNNPSAIFSTSFTVSVSSLLPFSVTTTKPSMILSSTQDISRASVIPRPSLSFISASFSDNIIFSSMITPTSVSRLYYNLSSQNYFTTFKSSTSLLHVFSSKITSKTSVVASSIPFISSSYLTFLIESEFFQQSLTASKDILSTLSSEISSFSSLQPELFSSSISLGLSTSSHLLSSPFETTSILVIITTAAPSHGVADTSMSSVSFKSVLFQTSFISSSDSFATNSSDPFATETISIASSILETSTFQLSFTSIPLQKSTLISTIGFISESVTSSFNTQFTEKSETKYYDSLQTSIPFLTSSKYISLSIPAAMPSTITTDFVSNSSFLFTSSVIKTAMLTSTSSSLPSSSSLVSSYTSYSSSPTFSSVMSLDTLTTNKSSDFLSSSSFSLQSIYSSVIPSLSISSLLSVQTLSLSASSSIIFKRSIVSGVSPSFLDFTYSFSTSAELTTSILTLQPTSSEASVMTSVPATSISPTRVSETYSFLSLSSSRVVSTAAPDQSPKLEKSIDHLNVVVGRYFEYQIPEDTFSDIEDGNTRNLSLRLSMTYSKPFPKGAWLMFNESSQTFFGIPLLNDLEGSKKISDFTLIAKDSKGQVAKDAITLTYENEKNVNHKLSITLNGSYETFTDNRETLIQVTRKLADYYEDEKLNFLSFSSVEKGSVVIVWSNNSLIGNTCQKEVIQNLYDRILDENGTISDQFLALFKDYIPMNTSLEYQGVCLLPVTSIAPSTKSSVTETDNKMWIEIVLPALIAVLVIVIIALILLICCRHRRPSKEIKDSEKPAFLEDRRPIIFPDELEMVDPSLKPKTPLVLPSDYLSETPPAVPPHGRQAPPYRAAMLDDDMFSREDDDQPPPPSFRGDSQNTEPPPYRLPPPYFNPHRMA